jgi:hypothetical protein
LSEHPTHENDNDALSEMYMKIKMGQPVGGHTGEHQGHSLESVRKVTYKSHQIVVKTLYEIHVDGKPLVEHIDVGNNGSVHSHTFPNYSFPSTIDFVKKLIDKYPDSFQSREHNHIGT